MWREVKRRGKIIKEGDFAPSPQRTPVTGRYMFRWLRKMNSLQRNTAVFRRCPSLRRFVKRSQLREAIRSGHFCALKRARVGSVSVQFQSKERGTRVKDRAKNGCSFRLTCALVDFKDVTGSLSCCHFCMEVN